MKYAFNEIGSHMVALEWKNLPWQQNCLCNVYLPLRYHVLHHYTIIVLYRSIFTMVRCAAVPYCILWYHIVLYCIIYSYPTNQPTTVSKTKLCGVISYRTIWYLTVLCGNDAMYRNSYVLHGLIYSYPNELHGIKYWTIWFHIISYNMVSCRTM